MTEEAKKCGKEVISFAFPAGEQSKTLATVQQLYETLIQAGFDRKDYLLALGGGVVGDLAGYAAATYLRWNSFCPDSDEPSGTDRQQCGRKDRCGF